MAITSDTNLELSEEEFNQIVHNSDKLIVASFFAEWHMQCLTISPILEELSEEIKNIQFVKINIEDNEVLSKKYNVYSLPCLILFKNGQEIERIAKCQSIDIIEEKIRTHAKKE
jgi:thioredoxin 1